MSFDDVFKKQDGSTSNRSKDQVCMHRVKSVLEQTYSDLDIERKNNITLQNQISELIDKHETLLSEKDALEKTIRKITCILY